MSLRFWINLVITLVVAGFAIVTAYLLVGDLKKSINEEIEAGTRVTVQLLQTVAASSQDAAEGGDEMAVLAMFLRDAGRVRANEIRLYDALDNLIYESPPSVYKQGRWAPEWFASLVRPEISDVRLDLPGGTIVVTPDSSRSVLDAWDELKWLGGLLLAFFVMLNLLVFWLLGRAMRPLRSILEGLSEMERGRFAVRLPEYRLPEFASISHSFNRMAQALEDSIVENRRLALIAQQSSDAIIIHDLEGRVSFWNSAAERMFGYRASQILGNSAMQLAPPEKQGELRDTLEKIRRRERVEHLETERLTRSGDLVDVALSAAPLVDPVSNEVIGEICAMRDMTEHKRMQQTEEELEQNRRLTQLIQSRLEEERRNIARELHDELGQCVTAIKSIGTAIANRRDGISEETRKNAGTIVSVASHIYDVVHSIIRQLRPSALDHLGLSEALREVVGAFQSRHAEVVAELVVGPDIDGSDESINITVYRIVQECLTNVIRHSQASRVTIAVSRDDSSSMGDALRVRVQDNGKGLDGPDASASSRFGLMGMRERVQAFGGSLDIASGGPREGVTVEAIIPVKQPQTEAAELTE
ncbi:MAG: PAS domain S-box protein [Betaproteobacteria bacterium]|nr:MAG: PAS domain S-box protein [Betaproteobacteria bacterium]